MSFNAGRAAGYQIGLVYHAMSGVSPTEAEIRTACARQVAISVASGRVWVEGGVSYDIRGEDVDVATSTDGCVEGFKGALSGHPDLARVGW
jgi:hypothetical protein